MADRIMKSILTLAIAPIALHGTATAAVLAGTLSGITVTQADLTTAGGLDWVYWDSSDGGTDSGTTSGNAATVTNSRSGGTGIGNLVYNDVNGSSLLGRNVGHGFTYSDGVSPTSETVGGSEYGIDISGAESDIAGASLSLTIMAATTEARVLTIYGHNRRTGTSITSSFSGDATTELDTFAGEDGGADWLYVLNFQADNVGQVLTVNLSPDGNSTDPANSSNSLRVAAATLAVPELSSCLLLGLGGLFLLVSRRR